MTQIYKNSEGKYYKLPENHPIVSLIYLLLLVFGGALTFSLLAFGLGIALYGTSLLTQLPEIMAGNRPDQINFLKLFQLLASIGTFIVPCYVLSRIESKRTTYFNFTLPVPNRLLLLSVVVMLVSLPLLELSILLNLKMQLPEFLSGLEAWMKKKELEMERMTHLLINTTTYGGLALNILMIAIIPGIGEELLFRGVLQNIFIRWIKSPHLAIWIVAILFSAIHVQFYGFLPRMLMGALFGYLYYWGKSIWLPILAHFANNAYAVISSFILLKQGKSIEEINQASSSSWFIYVLSFIGTAAIIYYFWQIAQRRSNTTLTEQKNGKELE